MAKEPHLPVIEARELLTRIENGDPLISHCERPAKETQTAVVVASIARSPGPVRLHLFAGGAF
jgi:hypothetical protein